MVTGEPHLNVLCFNKWSRATPFLQAALGSWLRRKAGRSGRCGSLHVVFLHDLGAQSPSRLEEDGAGDATWVRTPLPTGFRAEPHSGSLSYQTLRGSRGPCSVSLPRDGEATFRLHPPPSPSRISSFDNQAPAPAQQLLGVSERRRRCCLCSQLRGCSDCPRETEYVVDGGQAEQKHRTPTHDLQQPARKPAPSPRPPACKPAGCEADWQEVRLSPLVTTPRNGRPWAARAA